MKRLEHRQRAALALFIAFLVGSVGMAVADPQSADQPGVTLELSPHPPYAGTTNVQVTGAGFGSNTAGLIVQSAELPNGTTALSDTRGTFTSNSSGTFSQTVSVTPTFVDAGSGQTIDCNAAGVQCFVEATSTSGQFNSRHTISFGSGGTTTSSTLPPTTTSSTLPPTTTSSTLPPTTTSSTLPPTTTSSTLPPTTTSSTLPPTTTSSTLPPTTTSSTLPPTTTSSTLPPTSTSSTTAPTTTSSTSTTVAPTTTSTPTTIGGPTTTVGGSICDRLLAARAALNAQINAVSAAIVNSQLSPQQKAAVLAQLEAIRAQGNAQLNAQLAAAGCSAP